MMASQIYQELKAEDFEIRLLTILPSADFSAPINCRIHVTVLAQAPPPKYRALSYVWGDPGNTLEIFLNDVSFQVTVNLASALQHIRDKEEEVVLWADAICINQEDLDERSKQVQFVMDEVYKDAEEVLVWLGEESEDSDLAMNFMESWPVGTGQKSGDGGNASDPNENLKLAFESAVDAAAETALRALLQRPFWTRLWVLQEIVLAQKVLIICGHRCVPFESFVHAQSIWQQILAGYMENWRNAAGFISLTKLLTSALSKIIETREQYHSYYKDSLKWSQPLLDLLMGCSIRLDATDPRDKIYGLLGLGGPFGNYKSLVRPDYSKPIESVYCEIARALIEDDRSLRAVGYASCLSAAVDETSGLPSWVPDWRSGPGITNMFLYNRKSTKENPRAIEIEKFVRFSTDSQILWAHGVIGGKVSRLWSPGFPYLGDRGKSAQNIATWNSLNAVTNLDTLFRIISLDTNWVKIGDRKLRPSHRTYFVQAGEFLNDLISAFSPSDTWKGEPSLETLQNLFAEQLNLESSFKWPSEYDEDFQQYRKPLWAFKFRMKGITQRRTFFQTEDGLMGIGPPGMKFGDEVCVLMGYPAPFILRKVENHYVLLGECFVLDLMRSEHVIEMLKSPQEFEIH
jgi:hypothetical protein